MLTTHNNGSKSVESMLRELKDKSIIINDSYQRKFVWIDSQIKRDLIKTMILGMPIGTIIIWSRLKDDVVREEVIDGQQRLTTIKSFMDKGSANNFSLDENTIRNILKDKQILKILEKEAVVDLKTKNLLEWFYMEPGFKKISFEKLPTFFQKKITNYNLNTITIHTGGDGENYIREYFRVLQNQEKLKAGEILHSIPDNFLNNHLDNSQIDAFCKITHFNNLKWGFNKHFTVFAGLILDITRMGQTDKEVVKLSNKILDSDLRENEKFLSVIEKIKLDVLETDQEPLDNRLLTVLGLKLLLSTYLFASENFLNLSLEQRASIIKTISYLAGYWNSKDENKKNKLKVDFQIFRSYDVDKLIDGVRESWILSKTTHSRTEIEEKFRKINYLIDFLIEHNQEVIDLINLDSDYKNDSEYLGEETDSLL